MGCCDASPVAGTLVQCPAGIATVTSCGQHSFPSHLAGDVSYYKFQMGEPVGIMMDSHPGHPAHLAITRPMLYMLGKEIEQLLNAC